MSLSRTERFRLKSQVCEVIRNDDRWADPQINILLAEFGLERIELGWRSGDSLEEALVPLTDPDLIELSALVLDKSIDDVRANAVESDPGNWHPGKVRLFLSHSAQHKEFVGEIADELAVVGVHGFVAHDTMAFNEPWQTQIEQALRTMDAFVLLTHSEVNESAWCHQEVGWAFGRGVPIYAVRIGADPKGFMGSNQWPSCSSSNAREIADAINQWLIGIDDLGEVMVQGLFTALYETTDYMSSGAISKRVATLASLTEGQWERLNRIYWSNDQVYHCVLANKALEPFYKKHKKQFPPPNPEVDRAQ
ncbi:toll/interleukin-1 receptor domain-containing protein [Kocuria coralli]|uniref:Toll/interleukin-1 receptor domain-containing protein n=1 Tax=Kocuria coralli TaxID=1461025 RepID=A0A5J5KWR2_9MICC|nr:toll/interleukin-1 receptor domain-containing protein [Kocuria coralli]KAA9393848.1 toll/interleukin-1 receptor domain-containing protein [Kocuria coralli]